MAAVFNNIEFSMEQKRKLMISKWYARSLSNDKLIYSRDEDPENNIIIRSVYPNTTYRVFGLKEVANIKLLFVAILRLVCYDLTKLANKTRYVEKEDFRNLEKACNGLENYFKNRLIVNTAKNGEHSILFVLDNVAGSVVLKLNVNVDFPRILLTNCDSNGRHMNGISLFINESMAILKYLNSRFTFEDVIKEDGLSKEEQMTDNFF